MLGVDEIGKILQARLPGGPFDQGDQPGFVGIQTARKDVRLRKAEQLCPRRSPEARSEAPRCRPATSRSA